jgi:uncharacterized protein (TIGR03084 family)
MLNYNFDVSAMDYERLLTDLAAEGDDLDELVAGHAAWTTPTPAAGWTVAHELAHLAWSDGTVLIALRTPGAFADIEQRAAAAGARWADDAADAGAARPRADLLEQWRGGRAEVLAALRQVPRGHQFPWYGSAVSADFMAVLRTMETWAHGQDVYDAFGVAHPPTARLQTVAQFGVFGRELSFGAARLAPPSDPIRVELTGPAGQAWTWGPPDAAQRIAGSAEDFCLVVTRRRRADQTGLTATGADAAKWLELARVFL